jgi:hypothetical protein
VIGELVIEGADGLLAEMFVLAVMDVHDVDLSLWEELEETVGGKRGVSKEGAKLHCSLPILPHLIITLLVFVRFCLWSSSTKSSACT